MFVVFLKGGNGLLSKGYFRNKVALIISTCFLGGGTARKKGDVSLFFK